MSRKLTDFAEEVFSQFREKYAAPSLFAMTPEAIEKAIAGIAESLGATNVRVTRVHDSFDLFCDEPKDYKRRLTFMPTPSFQTELEALINKYSVENQSSTPDFILAEYLTGCLEVFNKTVIKRASWYGREAGKPGCLERNKDETGGVQATPGGQPSGSATHAVHTLG